MRMNTPPPPARLHDSFVIKPIELTPLLLQVGTLLHLTWIDQPAAAPRRRNASRRHRAAPALARAIIWMICTGWDASAMCAASKPSCASWNSRIRANEAVAAHLRTLVSNFDLKRYMNVLEAMRTNA